VGLASWASTLVVEDIERPDATAVQPDGSARPVRTVIDFHTIGSLLGAREASQAAAGGGSLTGANLTEC
jgi:hypothetical protein